MKIVDAFSLETIIPELQSTNKISVLEELSLPAASITGLPAIELSKILMEREQLGSTGIGNGIGIPHGKLANIDKMIVIFGRSKQGVEFESLDNKPVKLFFVLFTPEESAGLHLKLLARISRLLRNESFKQNLLKSSTREEIYNLICTEDSEF